MIVIVSHSHWLVENIEEFEAIWRINEIQGEFDDSGDTHSSSIILARTCDIILLIFFKQFRMDFCYSDEICDM